VLDDLDIGRGNDQRKRIIRLIEIGFALNLVAALPPHLDHADFREQRVLDEGIEHQETGILLHEDVVDVVGLLLGGGHVLGSDRRELHHLLARGEDLHQRRHQAFDGVGDVARDRLRAPIGGRHVLRHVAHVIVERGRALVGKLACRHGRERVVALGRQQGLEIAGGHFSHFATFGALGAQRRARAVVLENHREDRTRAARARRCSRADAGPQEARGIETVVNA
jgi:hypothetical protein